MEFSKRLLRGAGTSDERDVIIVGFIVSRGSYVSKVGKGRLIRRCIYSTSVSDECPTFVQMVSLELQRLKMSQ